MATDPDPGNILNWKARVSFLANSTLFLSVSGTDAGGQGSWPRDTEKDKHKLTRGNSRTLPS